MSFNSWWELIALGLDKNSTPDQVKEVAALAWIESSRQTNRRMTENLAKLLDFDVE